MFILILLLDVHQPPDALHPSSPSDTLTPTLFLQLISMQIEYAISIFSPFPLILVTLLHSLYALLVHLIESNLYMSAAAAFPTIQPSNRRSASLRTDSHHDFLLRLQPQPAAVDEHMDSATIHPLHVAQKKKKAEKPNEWAVVEDTKLRTAETTTTNGGHTAAAAGGARHLKYKKDISRWRRRIVHCHVFAAGYIAS